MEERLRSRVGDMVAEEGMCLGLMGVARLATFVKAVRMGLSL